MSICSGTVFNFTKYFSHRWMNYENMIFFCQALSWNKFCTLHIRLRYWIPFSAFLGFCWIVRGVLGIIYVTTPAADGSTTIVPNSVHLVYLLAYDIGTVVIEAQFFAVVYSSVILHCSMNLLSPPSWFSTQAIFSISILSVVSMIIDLTIYFTNRMWFRAVLVSFLALIELCLVVVASITFFQNRTVILQIMILPPGVKSPPGLEEKHNNQLDTLTRSVGVQIVVALVIATYQVVYILPYHF